MLQIALFLELRFGEKARIARKVELASDLLTVAVSTASFLGGIFVQILWLIRFINRAIKGLSGLRGRLQLFDI